MVHYQPFDSVHKRTEATVKAVDGHMFKVTKGAPQLGARLSGKAFGNVGRGTPLHYR